MLTSQPETRPAGGSAARRRRRGLFGPPPRLTLTSPLEGRLLWQIGDWGRASEHIGGRWETVAAELFRASLAPGQRLIAFAAQPTLMSEVFTSGLPHADALLARVADGNLLLEPLDFKWSLETASVKQVRVDTLARLLEQALPSLENVLAVARIELGLPADAALQPSDGRFLAPEHPRNWDALHVEPDLPSMLFPVDAQAFFQPLPAWAAAVELARLDRRDLTRTPGLEAVERYYRLGAGAQGAMARLRSSMFAEELQPLDATAAIAALRTNGRTPTIHELLLSLEQDLAARKVQEDRLVAFTRMAYPFGRFRADLAHAGVRAARRGSGAGLGRAHGEVVAKVTQAVRAAGRDLTVRGMATDEALAALEADVAHWQKLGREVAQDVALRLRVAEDAALQAHAADTPGQAAPTD